MPNIREVALACGVSPITVSAVLNNKPGKVSAQTRERVLETVRAMGYRPDASRRTKERRPRGTLGVITGSGGLYEELLLPGILATARRQEQNVTVFAPSLWLRDVHVSIRTYCDGHCDGLMVFAPAVGSAVVTALADRGVPFVLIGSIGDDDLVPCVDVDNRAAARIAVEYLLARGHRRVAFLPGPDSHRATRDRRAGYEDALALYGIAPDDSLVLPGTYEPQTGYRRTALLLERPPDCRPTALFCGNDELASGALEAARAAGLSVPRDLSVLGFDDDQRAAAETPPLTTVRQPYAELGRRAVAILLALIRGEVDVPRRQILPGELIVRDSVAPPRARAS